VLVIVYKKDVTREIYFLGFFFGNSFPYLSSKSTGDKPRKAGWKRLLL